MEGAKPEEVALSETLVETGYEVELHPSAHPELTLSGERGVHVLPRPFQVQYESNQRGGIYHYNMQYVARKLRKVSDGTLKHDWHALASLERLSSQRIFPNVLEMLQAAHRLLTGVQ